jgi:hypothetical protein
VEGEHSDFASDIPRIFIVTCFKGGEHRRVISACERRLLLKGRVFFCISEEPQHSISAPENQLIGVVCGDSGAEKGLP